MTHTANTATAPDAPATAGGQVLSCPDCAITAGPFPTRAETTLLAGIHDRLHHGGTPTAQVTGGGVCESCRTRPATRAWHHPAVGAPFRLCRSCWAATTPPESRSEGASR